MIHDIVGACGQGERRQEGIVIRSRVGVRVRAGIRRPDHEEVAVVVGRDQGPGRVEYPDLRVEATSRSESAPMSSARSMSSSTDSALASVKR